MEERVLKLENHYESLSVRMSGVETKMDKVLNILSDQRAKQLPPLQTILTTAAISTGLIGSIITGFFFLVDARVGAAVSTSNAFVASMTDRGGIWVQMAHTESRLAQLEKELGRAVKWRPSFEGETR